jgi:thiol-disulfide isomerase/thioredoxin
MNKKIMKVLKRIPYLIGIYVVGFILFMFLFVCISISHYRKETPKNLETSILPDWELLDQNGNAVRLSGHKGKYLLLDFWYSTCPPCLKSMKKLPQLALLAPDSLDIISISIERLDMMNKFINRQRAMNDATFTEYPNWFFYNLGNNSMDNLYKELKIKSYPTYILVDKEGKIVSFPIAQLIVLKTRRLLSNHLSLSEYITYYLEVLPPGNFKKYSIIYSLFIFLPIFTLFLLIKFLIRIINTAKEKSQPYCNVNFDSNNY